MKLTKSFLFVVLSFSLFSVSFLTLTPLSVFAQDTKIALQRGYRTGYSDGYMSGYRDSIDNAAKSYDKHGEYAKADRAYLQNYGSLKDYRDGYQQGFETGYNTGFEKLSFDAVLPINLNKRGVVAAAKTPVEIVAPVETVPTETVIEPKVPETTVAETVAPTETAAAPAETTVTTEEVSENTPADSTTTTAPPMVNASYASNNENEITIPTDTELIVELLGDINTEKSAVGDKFQARVVSPSELSGAIIEGRISKIQKPGRIKRRAEVSLSFDRIVLTERRWSNFNAILTEVLPQKGDNIRRVDTEGTVEGRSSVKSDITKIGASTGTGLVVGAIAGGPVGAAVGTGVGAAFGVGAVVVDRGKHIRINKNQQIRLRSVYETQIR